MILSRFPIDASEPRRRAAAAQQPRLAGVDREARQIMLPIPLAEPDNVANFQYHVFPVFCFSSAAIVTGSSVLWLQLV